MRICTVSDLHFLPLSNCPIFTSTDVACLLLNHFVRCNPVCYILNYLLLHSPMCSPNRAFSRDITVRCTWSSGVQVDCRISIAKWSTCKLHSKPGTDGLTCNIATHYMLRVRCKHTGCVVFDFPWQAPIWWYTKVVVIRRSTAE